MRFVAKGHFKDVKGNSIVFAELVISHNLCYTEYKKRRHRKKRGKTRCKTGTGTEEKKTDGKNRWKIWKTERYC